MVAFWLSLCVWCSLRNITIPAGFITKSDGQILKDLMDRTKGEAQEAWVVMDWNDVLPRAEKVSPSHVFSGAGRG